jgi:aspartokinase
MMNPRTKRPTASDLVPTAKAIKEMSYEEMETLYYHRKQRMGQQTMAQPSEKGATVWPASLRTYRNEM